MLAQTCAARGLRMRVASSCKLTMQAHIASIVQAILNAPVVARDG